MTVPENAISKHTEDAIEVAKLISDIIKGLEEEKPTTAPITTAIEARAFLIENLLGDRIPIAIEGEEIKITIPWDCPVCGKDTRYYGNVGAGPYITSCTQCGLEVTLVPD